MSLFVKEEYVNVTRHENYGCSEVYDTGVETPGELFRDCQKEFGRCTGKIYIDRASHGDPMHVGWTFLSRQSYEDCAKDTYLREVWVTVHREPDTVTRTPHYYALAASL